MPCKEEEDEVKTYLLTNRKNIILTINNDLKILDMPDTDWEKYVIKRPLPTYKEKIDDVEARLSEWAKSKRYRQQRLKLNDVATELGIAPMHISFCINARKKMTFTAWLNSLRIADAKKMIEKNPTLVISEVSHKVGYSGPVTFKPNFTKYAGSPVEEWIEKCKK